MRLFTFLVLTALLGTGCDAVLPGGCTAEAVPAIEITVVDAETGLGAPDGASGTLSDGTRTDSLFNYGREPNGSEVLVGGGSAGTYAVRVTNAGYQTWSRDGVRVRGGDCGPQTVRLTAELDRL